MPDDSDKRASDPTGTADSAAEGEPARERSDRGLSDLVKRAMSAGLEVASRSKDDFVRVATNEMRSWLERMDLPKELVKALTDTVVEVKAEIRFRPRADGTVAPEASTEVKAKPSKS
jgi:hypothetical protein